MPEQIDEQVPKIRRTNLRSDVHEKLRTLIVTARLKPGANVAERQLSAQLGVSRTPLREALLGLEAEGLLRTEPGRGFFVADMSIGEARELYAVIGALESATVERTRPRKLGGIDAANARLRAAVAGESVLTADRQWHEALLNQCDAPHTAAMLVRLRTLAARYEYRVVAQLRTGGPADQHDETLRLLREGRYQVAAGALREHWRRTLEIVERGLKPAGAAEPEA